MRTLLAACFFPIFVFLLGCSSTPKYQKLSENTYNLNHGEIVLKFDKKGVQGIYHWDGETTSVSAREWESWKKKKVDGKTVYFAANTGTPRLIEITEDAVLIIRSRSCAVVGKGKVFFFDDEEWSKVAYGSTKGLKELLRRS